MQMAGKSRFSDVPLAPPDSIFNVLARFNEDDDPRKVNLSVGAYRTEEGLPWVLPVVKTVEAQMSTDPVLNHEYLPLDGLKSFTEAAAKLLLGSDSPAFTQNRYCAVQAVSGTGSLRLALDFLKRYMKAKVVYVSQPTWVTHHGIAEDCGYESIQEYRYYKKETRGLDLEGMLEDLRNAPPNSVVVLHCAAHNPTGVDPSHEQWQQIVTVVKERGVFPLMDTAYQGFATGDVDRDAWPVREMVRQGMEMFAAQSFSKNFGLYNERVGQLCCVLNTSEAVAVVKSRIVQLARRMWSNSPNHGARIVATTLNNPTLYQEWLENLITMNDRITTMRKKLHHQLRMLGTPGDWTHIVSQIGMFSFTGLTPAQCDHLTKKHHIYLLSNGRINICGLNHGNIEYVAKAIDDSVRSIKN